MASKPRVVRTHTIYRISYRQPDSTSGVVNEWFTTFSKATRRLRQLMIQDSASVEVIDVPRTKVALAEWLNTHANVG